MSFDIPEDTEVLQDVEIEDAPAIAQGTYLPAHIDAELATLYHRGGLPRGSLTGWRCVDELYTVSGGQWTLVTGIPGMGKSEWLDALAVNLAESGEWHFGIYSPENWPVSSHVAKILEKHVRAPFTIGPTDRMTADQMHDASAWVHRNFTWLRPASTAPIEVVCHALGYVPRQPRKKLGIIVDPWNTLDHYHPEWRDQRMSETEFVSSTLTQLTRLLRCPGNETVHVWIVAHPAKLFRGDDGKYPMPTGYDVSGSAHWFNKADNIICVHRDKTADNQDVEIAVQKVRFKHTGKVGLTTLKYDRVVGRYFEWDGPAIRDVTGRVEQYQDPAR